MKFTLPHHKASIFREEHTLTSKQQGSNTGPSSSKHLNEERQFPPQPLLTQHSHVNIQTHVLDFRTSHIKTILPLLKSLNGPECSKESSI